MLTVTLIPIRSSVTAHMHIIGKRLFLYRYRVQCDRGPLYFTGITTYIVYTEITELAPKLTATASVAQPVERY